MHHPRRGTCNSDCANVAIPTPTEVVSTSPTAADSHGCIAPVVVFGSASFGVLHGARFARCARWPNPRYIVPGLRTPWGLMRYSGPGLRTPWATALTSALVRRSRASGEPQATFFILHIAYRTARPVAIRTLCNNNDNTIKQITVALGMGAPGTWTITRWGGTPRSA